VETHDAVYVLLILAHESNPPRASRYKGHPRHHSGTIARLGYIAGADAFGRQTARIGDYRPMRQQVIPVVAPPCVTGGIARIVVDLHFGLGCF
jgi:hypothetical protein